MPTPYTETFDHDPGGWITWASNSLGPKPLEIKDSCAVSRSPWWIDYNHALPGAGYLHLPFILITRGPLGEYTREIGGANRFIEANFPRDFTNAHITINVRGELIANGARLVLLCQSTQNNLCSGWLLTTQPITVTPQGAEQTLHLNTDENNWTHLGARHDRSDFYGRLPLKTVLCDVNSNLFFVLTPLNIVPMGKLDADPHRLRPEKDYPVWRSKLPEGYLMLDEVRIDFAG